MLNYKLENAYCNLPEASIDEEFISTELGVVILWVVTGLSTLVVALLIVGNEKVITISTGIYWAYMHSFDEVQCLMLQLVFFFRKRLVFFGQG